jgi:hypothetical protein
MAIDPRTIQPVLPLSAGQQGRPVLPSGVSAGPQGQHGQPVLPPGMHLPWNFPSGMTAQDVPQAQPMVAGPDPKVSPQSAARMAQLPTAGLVQIGTLDPFNRRKIPHPGGGFETMLTLTYPMEDGRVALIPTVYEGAAHTPQEAIQHFHQTKEHFGIFQNEEAANNYDRAMHNMIDPGSYERSMQEHAAGR